jgi:hypothetical protein
MKKNWIKGLDRVAVLLAIPCAILFGIYKSHSYENNNTLWLFYPDRITEGYMMKPAVNNLPLENARNWWGYSDRELVEFINFKNQSRVPQIENGLKKGFHLRDLKSVSPSKTELFVVGLLWAIGAAIIFVLMVGITTRGVPRTFLWLKNGFLTEEIIKK